MNMLGVWLRYFLLFFGLPPIGDPQKADIIIVQSFGRNSIIDDRLFEVRRIFDEAGSDQAATLKLRGLNFADGKRFDPGIPNRILANECQNLIERYNIPAIVQWEIATAFNPHWYWKNADKIICIWPSSNPGEYFSTWDLNKRAIELMKEKGFQSPIIMAHKWHIVRAFLITRKLVRKTFGVDSVVVVNQKTNFFDGNSVQVFTRNKYIWTAREALTRVHHLLKRIVI